jgi:hypothetical protein
MVTPSFWLSYKFILFLNSFILKKDQRKSLKCFTYSVSITSTHIYIMIWCTRNLTIVSEFWNEIIPEFTYLFLEEDVDKEEVYKMGSVLGEGDGLKVMLER